MEQISQLSTVVAIVMIAFFVGQAVKNTKLDEKWIPSICGFVGGVLGIVGMSVIPGYPANNWIDALAVGIASGLAATGSHQVYKQLFAKGDKHDSD